MCREGEEKGGREPMQGRGAPGWSGGAPPRGKEGINEMTAAQEKTDPRRDPQRRDEPAVVRGNFGKNPEERDRNEQCAARGQHLARDLGHFGEPRADERARDSESKDENDGDVPQFSL